MKKPKRLPLPKRFNVALTEKAYARLRRLNAKWGLGNNYLLTVILENLDDIASSQAMDKAFAEFVAEYGAPQAAGAKK